MRITVKVIPNAKKELIKQDGDMLKIYLTAPAIEGKGNTALVGFLARHYRVSKSAITITKGLKSRIKTITIEGI